MSKYLTQSAAQQTTTDEAMKISPQNARLHSLNHTLCLFVATLLPLMSANAEIGYEFVTIGNPGNAADATSYGRVDYHYRIGKYEMKIAQYAAFLNAVAATDTYGLYNAQMATDATIAGIARSGSPGSYTYSVIGDGNRPISYVSWFDAARMANWMHNGQPTGSQDSSTTESGAYSLSGATSGIINKNAGAVIFIPTENEWFKAAYYDPSLNTGVGGYWLYPTRSNSTPGNVVGPAANQVNYYTSSHAPYGLLSVTQKNQVEPNQTYLTPGGAFSGSGSAYGTFDQGGNVFEINDGVIGANRCMRGGCWWANNSGATAYLQSSGRAATEPTVENGIFGFRLAAVANPEIAVEQTAGNDLADGSSSVTFGAVKIGSSPIRVFTVRNVGNGPLGSLSISSDGDDSGDFAISSLGTTTLDAGQATTFTVTFAPIGTASGNRCAVIHIASNDTDENPFDIALAANAFSATADKDEDGLNDWAEHQLALLGFDWQVGQPSLVDTLNNGANAAGLYSLPQIHTLNVDAPLLTRDAGGSCKLTIGLQKSANLANGFTPFPFLAPQTTVNAQGQLEFTFDAPDNAAFFRVEAR